MPGALDLTNHRFGKLVARQKVPSKNGKTYWLCECDCGNWKEIQTTHLKDGSIQSCGCLRNNNPNKSITILKKICPICNSEFETQYYNRIYCYTCSPEQKQYGNQYQGIKSRAIKHQLILYKGGKCQKCGYNKCEGALQFHHLDPKEKDFTIGQVSLSKELNMDILYQEVDKCILVCANCHAEIHWNN